MTENEQGEYKLSIERRVTRLEGCYDSLCKSIDEIKDNHLVHLQTAVDKLQSSMTYGLWFIVITLVAVIMNFITRLYAI